MKIILFILSIISILSFISSKLRKAPVTLAVGALAHAALPHIVAGAQAVGHAAVTAGHAAVTAGHAVGHAASSAAQAAAPTLQQAGKAGVVAAGAAFGKATGEHVAKNVYGSGKKKTL